MVSPPLSLEVELLLRQIDSFEQLEVLFLLHRSPERWWSAASVASETKFTDADSIDALQTLSRSHLIGFRENGDQMEFRSASDHSELCCTIDSLVTVYRENPIEIMRRLNANSMERVRTSALKAFANAFLLRKGK
jgi:hypothetical protein